MGGTESSPKGGQKAQYRRLRACPLLISILQELIGGTKVLLEIIKII